MKRRTVAFILTGFVVASCSLSTAVCRADEADYWFEQGRAKCNFNLYGEALEYFNEALALNPKHLDALLLRGRVYFVLTDFNKALADFNRIIEINNRFAEAYYWRGRTYEEIKQTENAIKDLDKAIEIFPEKPSYYYERGLLYSKHRVRYGLEQARKDFRKACELGSSEGCVSLEILSE